MILDQANEFVRLVAVMLWQLLVTYAYFVRAFMGWQFMQNMDRAADGPASNMADGRIPLVPLVHLQSTSLRSPATISR
jgi:hypothetical protein